MFLPKTEINLVVLALNVLLAFIENMYDMRKNVIAIIASAI